MKKTCVWKCFLKACDMRILNSRSSQGKQFKEMFPTTFLTGNRHSYVTMKLRLALGFITQISLLGLMTASKERCVTVISHPMREGNRPTAEIQWIPGDGSFRHCCPSHLFCTSKISGFAVMLKLSNERQHCFQTPPVFADFQRQHLPSPSPFLHSQESP